MVRVMTRGRSAWVLNLDAEYELEASDSHTPSARTMQRMPEFQRALAPLLGPEDVVVGDDDVVVGSCPGRAWCPTPRAMRRLLKAGAIPVPAPDFAVLRRVNHRRFSADLGPTLPGARFVSSIEELEQVIAGESPSEQWLLKRPFGFAGRGRRRLARGFVDRAAMSWVHASFRAGDGLQVEPWVERIADYALHGFLSREGVATLGQPTRQKCDENGAWQNTETADDLEPAEEAELRASALLASEALHAANYFGPFGVDAYRWRDGRAVRFNPRSEINARYSMGWAMGMQRCRVDLA
jgi:hypothetical protein